MPVFPSTFSTVFSVGCKCTLSLLIRTIGHIHVNVGDYLYFPVPPPSLDITGVPLDVGFHAGLPLTLIARAEFPLAVDTPLSVSGVWSAPDDNSTRVSIVDPMLVQNRPTVYVSNYSLVLDMELDAGTYTFSLTISSSSAPFLTGTTISRARTITVLRK